MSQNTSEADRTSQESDQDRLFSAHANAAWGMAFVTTEAVSTATDAVADGFAALFQSLQHGTEIENMRFEVFRLTHSAAIRRAGSGSDTQQSREAVSMLGETKDRQATLALSAVDQKSRGLLWIVDAEGMAIDQAASIVDMKPDAAKKALDAARADFRRAYVAAARNENLGAECNETLDLLPAYSDHTLNHDDVAKVDTHLVDCDTCRNLAARLTDMESRMQSAVPAIPAWTRQYVIDTWQAVANSAALFEQRPPSGSKRASHLRGMAYAAAALVIVFAIALGLTHPSDDQSDLGESASSKLSAPKITTTTLPAGADFAVATPKVGPSEEKKKIEEPAPTTTLVPPNTQTPAKQQSPSTPRPTVAPKSSTNAKTTPTTSEGKELSTTTTDGGLVDLPSTPVNGK